MSNKLKKYVVQFSGEIIVSAVNYDDAKEQVYDVLAYKLPYYHNGHGGFKNGNFQIELPSHEDIVSRWVDKNYTDL